jgi:serine protease Do
MLGSAVFGFGGTYLANNLNGTTLPGVETVYTSIPENNTVIYQSVMQTLADNKVAQRMSIEEVVIAVKHSVVEIQTERVSTSRFMREFVSTGAGSGVIISVDGYIVTNDHVISGAQAITVRLSNEQEYEATLIGTDLKTDLAVLKINAEGLQPAILGHSSGLLVGQTAIAIGNPLGELGGTVTAGIISALDREITIDDETMSLLQTDAAVNPGNSGGGLFNLYGELIGVVNAKSSGSEIEGLGFAIPIDTTRVVIEQLIEYGYVRGRIDTGLTLVDIQDNFTAMSYRINQLGLYISNSISDNFKSGDRIIAVNEQSIANLAEWNNQVNTYNIGDTINVTVIRNGQNETYLLTLTEWTS